MFTVYRNGSVQFRSTADNLYSLDNVDKSGESRNKPDDDLYHYIDNDKKKNPQEQKYSQDAINSYKKIANMDTTDVVYHVQDIMTKDCITIKSDSTVQEAYELLKEKQISQVPVVNSTGQFISIINKKIILNLLMDDFDNGKRVLNQKLSSIDMPQSITAEPISDIRRVAKVMLNSKLDAVPVVNNNFLVGIVSKTDIIKAVSYMPDLKLWA